PDLDGTVNDAGGRDKLSIAEAILFRKDRFIDLAIHNQGHFVHGRPSSRHECMRHHEKALEIRARVQKEGDDHWHEMMLHEGFSLHYLVDMFASGHMRTPRAEIEQYLEDGIGLEWNPVTKAKDSLKDVPLKATVPGAGIAVDLYRSHEYGRPPG